MHQSKIDVINPNNGNLEFIIVNHINGKALIKVKDAIFYRLGGLSSAIYRTWSEHSLINTYSGNGQLRVNKYDSPFICLKEMEKAVIAIPKRKHDRVNEMRLRVAI